MSNVPRGWTTDEGRQLADTTRWPVLARLPDALADSLAVQSTKAGEIEHRFDPPQLGDFPRRDAVPASSHGVPAAPYVRARRHHGPSRNSAARIVRFAAIESFFQSAASAGRFRCASGAIPDDGRFIHCGRHLDPNDGPSGAAPTRSIEPAKTVAQPAVAPVKNADAHTVPAPTATGPIETQPESGSRVGRAEGDDFASQNNSAAGPVPTGHPSVTPPHFLISSGSLVPRVRVADSTPTAEANITAQGADG